MSPADASEVSPLDQSLIDLLQRRDLSMDFFYSSEVAEMHDGPGELIWPPSES